MAIDKEKDQVKESFICPHCKAMLKKKDCEHSFDNCYDHLLGKTISIAKQSPVKICYFVNGSRFDKIPDEYDYSLLRKIESTPFKFKIPVKRMPEGGESRRNDKYGVTFVHHFYTKRNLITLSAAIEASHKGRSIFAITAIMKILTKMYRWAPHGKCTAGMPGTLYLPSVTHEYSIFDVLKRRVNKLNEWLQVAKKFHNDVIVGCNALSDLLIPDNSIDYIFTDPPFGANLSYSELSFIWEAWIDVVTNTTNEAIINRVQNKELQEYLRLMTDCFKECYRVLKPNRWITIEFHNSQNSVWNAIQDAIQLSGFIIADVRTLNKKQGTFQQTTAQGAVKQDLVISAYKPKISMVREFSQKAGSEETVWAFVREHLSNVSKVVKKDGKLEIISERQAFLLWDRMVAYHIMQGISVPMNASEFYKGLDDRLIKRDDMYFLPDQVNEYDLARQECEIEDIQMSLFVTDEKSAIGWLYSQLDERSGGPQTYQVLQPKFMQELKAVDKREKLPELAVLLEENFLKDEEGRWYIPDLTKKGDVEKLREKNLLKEFRDYQQTKGKLKVFRSEAIRAGFKQLYKEKDFKGIVDMAERLPEETIQEDQSLLMYYDISVSKV